MIPQFKEGGGEGGGGGGERRKSVGHFIGTLSIVASWSLISLVVHEEPTPPGHCTQGEKALESLSSHAHPC